MVAGGGMSAASLAAASPLIAWAFSNALGIVGALIALIGLLVNLHYRHKASQRADQVAERDSVLAETESKIRVAAMQQGMELQRKEAEEKARTRALAHDLMRQGILPRDFSISDLAPLEMPVALRPARGQGEEDPQV